MICSVFGKACLPVFEDLPEVLKAQYNAVVATLGIENVGQAISDIMNSWKLYLIAFGTTFVITFIYFYLVRLFAGPIVWASIILGIGGLLGLGFWLRNYALARPE